MDVTGKRQANFRLHYTYRFPNRIAFISEVSLAIRFWILCTQYKTAWLVRIHLCRL